jgi:hypothetical protein
VSDPSPTGKRILALCALAMLVHAGFDLVTWPSAWTRAPYLRVEDMNEAFAGLSPVGISIAASAVSGVIAGLALVAFEPARGRRARSLGLALAAFWIFSALLTHAVWLSTPWTYALVALPLGVPRGLAVGWLLARLAPAAPAPARE